MVNKTSQKGWACPLETCVQHSKRNQTKGSKNSVTEV